MERDVNNETNKISIIIPCYNEETLICRCLDSILQQTVGITNLEIICVDDCSTDGTRAVLQDYEQHYPDTIMLVLLDENGKQGRARNIGMTYASGEYVTFVDADDFIDPRMLEEMLACARQSGCEIVECGYQLFKDEVTEDAEEGEALQFHLDNSEEKRNYLLRCGCKMGPCGRLYRREFLLVNNIKFPERTYMEDVYFSCQCMLHLKIFVYLPRTYYFYYFNEQGSVHSVKTGSYYINGQEMMNKGTELLRAHHWYDDCMQEYAFCHFLHAFVNPMARMMGEMHLFSYETYQMLKRDLLTYFPEIVTNKYAAGSEGITFICLQLASHDFTEKQLREILTEE